jgi:hypothetical protein
MPWYVVTGVLRPAEGEPPKAGPRPVWGPYDTEADAHRFALPIPGTYVEEAADQSEALRRAFEEAALPLPEGAIAPS